MAGLFLFPETLIKGRADFLHELSEIGIDSLNLSLKYHASRHLSIRKDVSLIHTSDGQHFYQPNPHHYELEESIPLTSNPLLTNKVMEEIFTDAQSSGISIGAWSVFLHDEAFGIAHPETFAINVFGQSLRPNLCPLNPVVQSYLVGHTRDLVSMGFKHIAFESINFSPFRHNEHHERYFVEMSLATEFLLGLCFCISCTALFLGHEIDVDVLKNLLVKRLKSNLEDVDAWLNISLTRELLINEFGLEIEKLLSARCSAISELHKKLLLELSHSRVTSRFLDGSPISNRESNSPFDDLWQCGIDPSYLEKNFDFIEPLLYRFSTAENLKVSGHYLERFGVKKLIGAIRPTFPDLAHPNELEERIISLRNLFEGRLEFYLYEIIRKKEFDSLRKYLL